MPDGSRFEHAFVGPLIRPGVDGALFTICKLRALVVPQSFTALTVIALLVNPLAKLTVTIVSLIPDPFGCVIVVVPDCAVQI